MISERREQRSGVADFFRRQEQQVASSSFGNTKIRRVQTCPTWKAGARTRGLLLRDDQQWDREDSSGCDPHPCYGRRNGGAHLHVDVIGWTAVYGSSGLPAHRSQQRRGI